MRDKKNTILESIDNLYLSIYIIGYTNQGESSVLILYTEKEEKKKILCSMVIDCYEEDEINRTVDILKSFSNKLKLDMLVWTHPHDDHTLGIDKIIKTYCNKNTKIITSNVLNTTDKYSTTCNNIKNFIANLNKSQKKRWNISQNECMGNILQQTIFPNAGDLLDKLTIKCVAPCSDIISKEIGTNEINKLSIGILIELERKDGNINFLFTGDMENQTIRAVAQQQENEEMPNIYNYIKLPHHGGKSGEYLVKLLDKKNKSQFGVSTVFKNTIREFVEHNPERSVLETYKNYINQVACTSDAFNNKYGIGVIHVKYDLGTKEADITHEGTSCINIV